MKEIKYKIKIDVREEGECIRYPVAGEVHIIKGPATITERWKIENLSPEEIQLYERLLEKPKLYTNVSGEKEYELVNGSKIVLKGPVRVRVELEK